MRNPLFIGFICIIVIAVLIVNTRLLPFVDLPNHLAEAAIFRHLLNSDKVFDAYYEMVPWFYPNTFHPYVVSLFPSAEMGDRIYFLIYLVCLPLSVYLVIRKVDGNQWVGLLSILLVFNYNVTFGFVGFYMAIPFVLKDTFQSSINGRRSSHLISITFIRSPGVIWPE
ncbi:MAG: hypothetical protein P8X57_07435 [Cyclobacteriaceae bacterium]